MEIEIDHQDILLKKHKLLGVCRELKTQFIGLDTIIDEIMGLVAGWYIFPQSQLRPLVVNLWGMTGSGKTALVKALVAQLEFNRMFAHMDMGEYESGSASLLKDTLTDDLIGFHGKPCILCLDEFQFARTLDEDGEDLGKDKLRVIWELLDSGRISYLPYNTTAYARRASACLGLLGKAKAAGVTVHKGVVSQNTEAFNTIFAHFFFDSDFRDHTPLEASYFLSLDFIAGLHILLDDDDLSREHIREQIRQCDLDGICGLLTSALKGRHALKELDLSQALIFVLGNLDEAYDMSRSVNPDIDADELHANTLRINLSNIKSALAQRFRPEQLARLGNNHVIYRAFTRAHYRELISRELGKIADFVYRQLHLKLVFHESIHEMIYNEGVFPAQGTRPVLTTVNNLIGSRISTVAMEVIAMQSSVVLVEWSYTDGKYLFVFKEEGNAILNMYEETVTLKVDPLRRMCNKDLQVHTAVHESGHAVLAALTLRILPSLVVSKSADDKCEGFCMVNMPEGLLTRDVLRKDIIISLGGYVAEKMIFGAEHTSSGVRADIDHATQLANKAIKDYAMGIEPISIAVPSPGNNDFFFMEAHHREQAMALIQECEAEAQRILDRNRLLLLKLSEYLSYHYKAEEAVIGDFVRKYAVDSWVQSEGFKTRDRYFSFEKELWQQIHELENAVHSVQTRSK